MWQPVPRPCVCELAGAELVRRPAAALHSCDQRPHGDWARRYGHTVSHAMENAYAELPSPKQGPYEDPPRARTRNRMEIINYHRKSCKITRSNLKSMRNHECPSRRLAPKGRLRTIWALYARSVRIQRRVSTKIHLEQEFLKVRGVVEAFSSGLLPQNPPTFTSIQNW